ncbi:MAG: hypothetical protein AABW51_03500 [Nanoarchaeota archaeon]
MKFKEFIKPKLVKVVVFIIIGGYFTFFSNSIIEPSCQSEKIYIPEGILANLMLCPHFYGNPLPARTNDPRTIDYVIDNYGIPNYITIVIDILFWYIISCVVVELYYLLRNKK